jgi:hypothetical protein
VPHGVDAAVDGVEAAGAETAFDGAVAQAEGAELRERDDAMLPPSEFSDPDIWGCSTLTTHMVAKVEHPPSAPP